MRSSTKSLLIPLDELLGPEPSQGTGGGGLAGGGMVSGGAVGGAIAGFRRRRMRSAAITTIAAPTRRKPR